MVHTSPPARAQHSDTSERYPVQYPFPVNPHEVVPFCGEPTNTVCWHSASHVERNGENPFASIRRTLSTGVRHIHCLEGLQATRTDIYPSATLAAPSSARRISTLTYRGVFSSKNNSELRHRSGRLCDHDCDSQCQQEAFSGHPLA